MAVAWYSAGVPSLETGVVTSVTSTKLKNCHKSSVHKFTYKRTSSRLGRYTIVKRWYKK